MLKRLMTTAGAIALLAGAGGAHAQTAATSAAATSDVEGVVVTADPAGLLERRPSNTVFGLDKPLIETPRAATFVSDTTLERYGIKTVDDLVAISPSSYTSSFYGVPGSLNVRGTLAENYFRGFKRIENRGTYATPLGDAAQVEVVRGPPTPIFGSGKVGGLLNFIPKSGKMEGKYIAEPTGELTLTGGSYNKKIATLQGGLPLNFGDKEGGLYAYGEIEDSHSFYHGIYPKRQTLEISTDMDWGHGWSTSFGGMYYHSKGDVQTAGWNRLTQSLIDTGTYVTGRDTDLKDTNGSGKIEPSEVGFYPFATALYLFGGTDAKHTLDVGVGTTKLSPRTVYISSADFSRTDTGTLYFDLAKEVTATSAVKLQLFYDKLDNQRFVSYGFPASYQSYVGEARLSYNFALDAADGFVSSKSFVGVSSRNTHGHSRESFNSGLIALDRRDISAGAQPNDIIDSPYSPDPPGSVGLGWENDVYTNSRQNGVFATTDIAVGGKLDLILGGRYDDYSVTSRELGGAIAFEAPYGRAGKGMGTYTLAVTYKLPYGFMPYYTYSKAAALEVGQASQIPTSLLAGSDGGWLSDSYLSEGGLKFSLLNNTLVGSLAAYRQLRTRLTQGGGVTTVVGTRSTVGWRPRTCRSPSPATCSTPRSRARTRASSTCRPRCSESRPSTGSAEPMSASTSPASAGPPTTTTG
jgi:iron complex outermembrane receptor protein